jgi:hypothetical protein
MVNRARYRPSDVVVALDVKGCVGATPVVSCQIVEPMSAANARLPVEPTD